MSDLKRYVVSSGPSRIEVEEDSDGEWVKYEDAAARISELEAENFCLMSIKDAAMTVAIGGYAQGDGGEVLNRGVLEHLRKVLREAAAAAKDAE